MFFKIRVDSRNEAHVRCTIFGADTELGQTLAMSGTLAWSVSEYDHFRDSFLLGANGIDHNVEIEDPFAECVQCGNINTVCCDEGTNENGTHIDPVCVKCCDNPISHANPNQHKTQSLTGNCPLCHTPLEEHDRESILQHSVCRVCASVPICDNDGEKLTTIVNLEEADIPGHDQAMLIVRKVSLMKCPVCDKMYWKQLQSKRYEPVLYR